MITPDGMAVVEEIIRDVARREVMPRWRHLADVDIAEKSPGDLVTVADKAAEVELTRLLTAFVPGSVVVGSRAASPLWRT